MITLVRLNRACPTVTNLVIVRDRRCYERHDCIGDVQLSAVSFEIVFVQLLLRTHGKDIP